MAPTTSSVRTIRTALENRERETLSPFAAPAAESRGRAEAEGEHPYRTAYQRDRILHTKAFRRLKGKTQVFLAPKGDHYRTRLTHTLEVAQIARTVGRALGLNEDLIEAIALGHDLGHTPFGHAGEQVLNERFSDGFRHYEQSLRVVDLLETRSRGERGLNLTWEVRDGILNHSRGKVVLLGGEGTKASTLEGQAVSVCDAIAYISHDVDDALRAGLVQLGELPSDAIAHLGATTSQRIDTMVTGLIEGSPEGRIEVAEPTRGAIISLREYLYKHVYPSASIHGEIEKAKGILGQLYDYFLEHEDELPEAVNKSDGTERRVVDRLAGMTDQYALQLYQQQFFPDTWPR